MRYGDGGGLDRAARARRERVRLRAADLFAQGMSALDVAGMLEVSTKSAYQWRRAWVAGGLRALASTGAPGPAPMLSDEQLARLSVRLEQGPAAAGFEQDPRWTLARIRMLIGAMFHVRVGSRRCGRRWGVWATRRSCRPAALLSVMKRRSRVGAGTRGRG